MAGGGDGTATASVIEVENPARRRSPRFPSSAGPRGELHDTSGVWIGDASAFPSPSGFNPMLTIMALARRTAHAIVAAG